MDIIIGMPSVFRNVVVKPIPKGEKKVTSLFENYKGIALVASFNKHLEVFGSSYVSLKCQFCFKPAWFFHHAAYRGFQGHCLSISLLWF